MDMSYASCALLLRLLILQYKRHHAGINPNRHDWKEILVTVLKTRKWSWWDVFVLIFTVIFQDVNILTLSDLAAFHSSPIKLSGLIILYNQGLQHNFRLCLDGHRILKHAAKEFKAKCPPFLLFCAIIADEALKVRIGTTLNMAST